MNQHRKFKGRNKTEICIEAFARLGHKASKQAVSNYFRSYGIITPVEDSMYYTLRKRARMLQPKKSVFAILKQVKALAEDVGGTEKLKELVEIFGSVKNVDKLLKFAENYN